MAPDWNCFDDARRELAVAGEALRRSVRGGGRRRGRRRRDDQARERDKAEYDKVTLHRLLPRGRPFAVKSTRASIYPSLTSDKRGGGEDAVPARLAAA